LRVSRKNREARASRMYSPRPKRTIAHNVKPKLAVPAFAVAVHFTRRSLNAMHHQLEMIHQVFDVRIHALLGRQRDSPIVDLIWSLGQVVERLIADAQALP